VLDQTLLPKKHKFDEKATFYFFQIHINF